MIAYQLTIPRENRPGMLAEVSGILAREKINIRAITISSFGERGFFNLLVDDPRLAERALQRDGIPARLQEIIAVLIEDRPGGMDSLVQFLARENVNIENAYGFVLESHRMAVFVLDVADPEKTLRLLRKHGFKTLSPEALATIEPFHYMEY
jgi:hypothetical protein